ncbi:MAG: hypothetical protein AAF708_04075 [Deinococcota bacterium]
MMQNNQVSKGMSQYKDHERLIFWAGCVFIVALLTISIFITDMAPITYLAFRVILALSASSVSTLIPGLLDIKLNKWLKAGGALGIFVIVYFINPAPL